MKLNMQYKIKQYIYSNDSKIKSQDCVNKVYLLSYIRKMPFKARHYDVLSGYVIFGLFKDINLSSNVDLYTLTFNEYSVP